MPAYAQDAPCLGAARSCANDAEVVQSIWSHVEHLLSSGSTAAGKWVRQSSHLLCPVQALPTEDLLQMALLHLSSSRHLMQTAQYLVPEVFTGDQCDPHLLETCDLPDSKLHVLSAIVELQLFHLLRVKEANCQMRLLAMQKQSATQQQQQQQVVNSSCSSSKLTAMDDSLVESWD